MSLPVLGEAGGVAESDYSVADTPKAEEHTISLAESVARPMPDVTEPGQFLRASRG